MISSYILDVRVVVCTEIDSSFLRAAVESLLLMVVSVCIVGFRKLRAIGDVQASKGPEISCGCAAPPRRRGLWVNSSTAVTEGETHSPSLMIRKFFDSPFERANLLDTGTYFSRYARLGL